MGSTMERVWSNINPKIYLEQNIDSDLDIITNDGTISCHSFMMCAASSVLEECILASDFQTCECQKICISLPDFSILEVNALTEIIYGVRRKVSDRVGQLMTMLDIWRMYSKDSETHKPTEQSDTVKVEPAEEYKDEKNLEPENWEDSLNDDCHDQDYEPPQPRKRRKRTSTGKEFKVHVPSVIPSKLQHLIVKKPSPPPFRDDFHDQDYKPPQPQNRRRRRMCRENVQTTVPPVKLLNFKEPLRPTFGSACLPIVGPFDCSFCDFKSGALPLYVDHLMKVHKKAYCVECQKPITNYQLIKHCQRHPIECLMCKIHLANQEDVTKHRLNVHSLETYRSCVHCHIKFGNDEAVSTHEGNCVQLTVQEIENNRIMRPRHEYNLTKNVPFPVTDDPTVCPASGCQYRHPKPSFVRHHYFVKHCKQKCPHCEKVLGVYHLEDHVITVHTKKFEHVCHICSQGFFRKNKLQHHIDEEHIKDPKFVCDTCGKKFFSLPKLTKHKSMSHVSHKCQFCDKAYTMKKALQKHLNSQHNGMGLEDLYRDRHGNVRDVKALKDSHNTRKIEVNLLGAETIAAHVQKASVTE